MLSIVHWHLRTKDEVSCENCFSMIPRDISIISKFLKFKLQTTMKSAKRNLDASLEVECWSRMSRALGDLYFILQSALDSIRVFAFILHFWHSLFSRRRLNQNTNLNVEEYNCVCVLSRINDLIQAGKNLIFEVIATADRKIESVWKLFCGCLFCYQFCL